MDQVSKPPAKLYNSYVFVRLGNVNEHSTHKFWALHWSFVPMDLSTLIWATWTGLLSSGKRPSYSVAGLGHGGPRKGGKKRFPNPKAIGLRWCSSVKEVCSWLGSCGGEEWQRRVLRASPVTELNDLAINQVVRAKLYNNDFLFIYKNFFIINYINVPHSLS